MASSCRLSSRSGDCDVGHDAVSAADTLDVFDDVIEALGAGVGDLLGQGDQDGRPPGFDGCGQPAGFGHVGVTARAVEAPEPGRITARAVELLSDSRFPAVSRLFRFMETAGGVDRP